MSEHAVIAGTPDASWVDEVLGYWFETLAESDWWGKHDAIDAEISRRFGALRAHLLANEGAGVAGPRPRLAAVLALDQFSRHLYRGDPRAFEADPLARRLARMAIAAGEDQQLTSAQRLFLYLPFEHSEDPADQALAVALISQLGNDEWTAFAHAHRAIIERFGRFPHRNAILGRASSEAELAHLAQPNSSF